MRQNAPPQAQNGLKLFFEYPKWSSNNFYKNHFFRPGDPSGPTVGPNRAQAGLPSGSTKCPLVRGCRRLIGGLGALETTKSGASYHRALAKEDEATHSPGSWETKGSRKLLAPLKRVSVILGSRRASREKGITSAKQGKEEVGNGVSGGPPLRQAKLRGPT